MLCGFSKNELCLICESLHGMLVDPTKDPDGGRRFIKEQVNDAIRNEEADKKWDVNRTAISEKLETLEGWHAKQLLQCVGKFWALKDEDVDAKLSKAGFGAPTAYLMNSAVIPSGAGASGNYRYTWYSTANGTLERFIKDKHPVSRIGFEDVCDVIHSMTGGYRPRLSRAAALIEQPGDCAMIIRLKYRLADGAKSKMRMRKKEDYELGLLERLD